MYINTHIHLVRQVSTPENLLLHGSTSLCLYRHMHASKDRYTHIHYSKYVITKPSLSTPPSAPQLPNLRIQLQIVHSQSLLCPTLWSYKFGVSTSSKRACVCAVLLPRAQAGRLMRDAPRCRIGCCGEAREIRAR